ncbi:TIGR02569 family protein [Nocardioides taihuensis]|uniref:TIGR02569 family protein n=1 Tax=Nocardioides taihuensis TaxID=1835606 RepID=A0ABW0BQP5_9ACTN
MPPTPPPASVVRAFGAVDPPRALVGGQGTSWISGDLVLKPTGGPVHDWLAEALEDVTPDGFRLAAPVRSRLGTWSWAGWSATRWVEGSEPAFTMLPAWLRIIEAGRAFHRAVAHLGRPDCLDRRDDRWAVADRMAWGERDLAIHPELADVGRRLQGAVEPLGAAQVVHGDLTGNVLLSPTLPPAVIDIAPYWRPPAYAEGVVVADALCRPDTPPSLVDRADVPLAATARALLFRMATTSLAGSNHGARVDVADAARRYDAAARAIGV